MAKFMWKATIYKEWIKIRWVTLIFTLIGLAAVGNIFLKVRHEFVFNEASVYWYNILFQNDQFFNYGLFKFVPALGALAIALAQFFPETVNKRIKLTFHLPLNENRSLLQMIAFGTVCLLATYMVILILFTGLSFWFFPVEIIGKTFISIAPWFMGGFVVYYLVALIVLEPIWKYRFLYFIASATFLPVYFEKAKFEGYAPAIPIVLLFAVLLSFSPLFSGYRFRKGEM